MNWILFIVYISAVDGSLDHYETRPMADINECVSNLTAISPVEHGLAKVLVCRAVDKDGKPVLEYKVDPSGKPLNSDGTGPQPESPKQRL